MTGPELAYFIGSPRRRYGDTEWDAYMERWTLAPIPGLRLSYPGDKCDVARSRHINAAKGLAPIDDKGIGFAGAMTLKEPPAVTIQIDDDVWPRQHISEMLRLLHQDFEDGFDVVTAPTVNNETLNVMVWTDDGLMPSDRCVEVSFTAFGFVAFSPKFIREVKPEGEELFWPGTPQAQSVPTYCHFALNTDDSMSFSQLVRDQGFKLGCDARLMVTHRKALDLDPTSANWWLDFRNISKAQRPDLYLKARAVVREGLEKGVEEEKKE